MAINFDSNVRYINIPSGQVSRITRKSDSAVLWQLVEPRLIDYFAFDIYAVNLDTTSAQGTNLKESTMAGIKNYGSVTYGSNYIQVTSTRTTSNIQVAVNGTIHYKAQRYNSDWERLDWYAQNSDKTYGNSILIYELSVTGSNPIGSGSSYWYGWFTNRFFGNNAILEGSGNSSKTMTFKNATAWEDDYGIAYIGAGRQTGSRSVGSKMVFNSVKINGVSIPIKVTCSAN